MQAATKCFRSVEPGYYFEKGLLAHEIRATSSGRLDVELDFRTVKDGILVHTIGDHTDLFLTLNQGQVSSDCSWLLEVDLKFSGYAKFK